jgi:hypothetical protein
MIFKPLSEILDETKSNQKGQNKDIYFKISQSDVFEWENSAAGIDTTKRLAK